MRKKRERVPFLYHEAIANNTNSYKIISCDKVTFVNKNRTNKKRRVKPEAKSRKTKKTLEQKFSMKLIAFVFINKILHDDSPKTSIIITLNFIKYIDPIQQMGNATIFS